ncbi:hypothetical protein MTBSS4_60153 [Magnetospirillum sp. SS-4]|nr:hypothetical protein MTBSS4_60153 [Magnetospirillum sp. SS-4]
MPLSHCSPSGGRLLYNRRRNDYIHSVGV